MLLLAGSSRTLRSLPLVRVNLSARHSARASKMSMAGVGRTYTKHGPGSMDHPMDLVHGPPLIFKRKSPLLIRKFTGGQGMTDTFYVLEGLSRNSGLLWIEGAGVSSVTRQPTPSKVMLRLIQKLKTHCAPPLKLQATQWIKLYSSICLDYRFVFLGKLRL